MNGLIIRSDAIDPVPVGAAYIFYVIYCSLYSSDAPLTETPYAILE